MEIGDLVICSLEVWDDVWRRNQLVVKELMAADPGARVLFVEPAVDVTYEISQRRTPRRGGIRQHSNSLWSFQPRKYLPRLIAPDLTERRIAAQVQDLTARLGFIDPLLWINDYSYAMLGMEVNWPVLYDVTDDWLHSHLSKRALRRARMQDAALLGRADEVIVVSESLKSSRGAHRPVHLIPDGVDIAHFSRLMPRPLDLPAGPVAVYVGTLHEDRIDVDLSISLARNIAPVPVCFVGPNAMSSATTARLTKGGCHLLGSRPYDAIPAYYQHATLIVVPHRVTPFTESLDPIKGYECLTVGTPTLSTPIAGMRELGPPIEIAPANDFVARAKALLSDPPKAQPRQAPTWHERARQFRVIMEAARGKACGRAGRSSLTTA